MNIIKIFLPIVNPLIRSKVLWVVAGGLVLLLWLVKFDFSKIVKIIKLLFDLVSNLFALFISLTFFPFIKDFQKTEEI